MMLTREEPQVYHTVGIPIGKPIKPSKSWYIFKVLNIVFLQLLTTVAISIITYYNKQKILNYYKEDIGLLILPMILSFTSLLSLMCCKQIKIVSYILLIIFTISLAFTLAIGILPLAPNTLIQATGATAVSILSINTYAYYCAKQNKDFGYLEPALLGMLCGLLIISLLQTFIHSTILGLFIAITGVGLFSLYLLYDLNRLYNNPNEYEEDPILIAISIYLDIINLFIYILECIQICNKE